MNIPHSSLSGFKQLDRPTQLSQFNEQIVAYRKVPLNQTVNRAALTHFAFIHEAKCSNGERSGYFIERLVESPALYKGEYTQIDNFDIYSKNCKEFKELHMRSPSLTELKDLNEAKEEYSFNFSEYFQPGITSSLIQRQYLKAMQKTINTAPSPTGVADLNS